MLSNGFKVSNIDSKGNYSSFRKNRISKSFPKGSHPKYKNQSFPVRVVIIPIHSEIARGTLKSILEQANISLDDFLNLL